MIHPIFDGVKVRPGHSVKVVGDGKVDSMNAVFLRALKVGKQILVSGVADCENCHVARMVFGDPGFAILAPNRLALVLSRVNT
jgi:hypothetical protein